MTGSAHPVDRGHSETVRGEGLEIGDPVDGGVGLGLQDAAVAVPGAVFPFPDVDEVVGHE